jgi:hypothetical protein
MALPRKDQDVKNAHDFLRYLKPMTASTSEAPVWFSR